MPQTKYGSIYYLQSYSSVVRQDCLGGTSQTIYQAQSANKRMYGPVLSDDGKLYLVDGLSLNNTTCKLMEIDVQKQGYPSRCVYTSSDMWEMFMKSSSEAMGVNNGYFYWFGSKGNDFLFHRINVKQEGAKAELLTKIQGGQYGGMAFDSEGNVYWCSAFKGVYKYTVSNGALECVWKSKGRQMKGLAIDSKDNMYFTDKTSVYYLAKGEQNAVEIRKDTLPGLWALKCLTFDEQSNLLYYVGNTGVMSRFNVDDASTIERIGKMPTSIVTPYIALEAGEVALGSQAEEQKSLGTPPDGQPGFFYLSNNSTLSWTDLTGSAKKDLLKATHKYLFGPVVDSVHHKVYMIDGLPMVGQKGFIRSYNYKTGKIEQLFGTDEQQLIFQHASREGMAVDSNSETFYYISQCVLRALDKGAKKPRTVLNLPQSQFGAFGIDQQGFLYVPSLTSGVLKVNPKQGTSELLFKSKKGQTKHCFFHQPSGNLYWADGQLILCNDQIIHTDKDYVKAVRLASDGTLYWVTKLSMGQHVLHWKKGDQAEQRKTIQTDSQSNSFYLGETLPPQQQSSGQEGGAQIGGDSSGSVKEILESCKCGAYLSKLQEEGVESVEDLLMLEDDDLKDLIPKLIHRKKLSAKLVELRK